jgi:uncharacterized integral membrane protein (TIGR00697 family)
LPQTPVTPSLARRSFKYYDMLMAAFVTVLLCSNLIGPGKSCALDLHSTVVPHFSFKDGLSWSTLLIFGAGNMFFPISYIFDDVLTEVYGYAKARKVIWAGFISMIFATLMAQVIIHLPQNPDEPYNKVIQPAIEACFGNTWRIVVASMMAFWAGDFANSYVMAKMKILTKGRMLWTRTIGSTIVGEGLDSLIFYPIAFAGLWTTENLISIIVFNWFFKTMVEVLMTPVTYAVVGFLKRAEHEDYYDVGTDFNPFTLKD